MFLRLILVTQKIISKKRKYINQQSLKPFIQITDNRGTGAGWKVTAAASSFKRWILKDTVFPVQ